MSKSRNGIVPWKISYFAGIVLNEVNSEPLVHIVIIQFLKRKTSKLISARWRRRKFVQN